MTECHETSFVGGVWERDYLDYCTKNTTVYSVPERKDLCRS